MSLEDVPWSDIEAAHRGHDRWIDTKAPALLGIEAPTDDAPVGRPAVNYRLPDSLQITSFSLDATAPTDDAAVELANRAAALLIENQLAEDSARLDLDQAALERRIETATAERDTILADLQQLRTEQLSLIDDNAEEAVVSRVTGDIWATETKRVEWEREIDSARTELNRLTAQEETLRPSIALLGDARVEQSAAAGSGGPGKLLAGGLVGLWLATIAAYWMELKRGRIRDGQHPTLLDLGIPVTNLGNRGIDGAASLALADAIANQGMLVSLVDTRRDGPAGAVALVLTEGLNLDADTVRAMPLGTDEADMVGSLGMLVAVTGETRISELMARFRRCQELEIPVVRVVLVGPRTVRRLREWAGSAFAPA